LKTAVLVIVSISYALHCRLYYEDWAFLLDEEKSAMLPNMAAGM